MVAAISSSGTGAVVDLQFTVAGDMPLDNWVLCVGRSSEMAPRL
jgi:hypothetical protein